MSLTKVISALLTKNAVGVQRCWCSSIREVPKSPSTPVDSFTPTVKEYEKRDVSLTAHPISFFFNTHSAVKNLEKYGFSYEEAEAVTELLTQIVLAQSDSQHRNLISKQQLEISVQQLLAQIDSVKKDMSILEKSQFAKMQHDLEKLTMSIKQLDTKLLDEVTKLKGGFALDVNLEKSRANEEDHKIQVEMQNLTNKIALESAKTQAAMANLRAHFESSRTETIKYIAATATGTMVSVCTIGFLVYRLMAS